MAANGVPVESETQTKNDSDSKNCRESSKSIISPTSISFRWLDILEKEFDTAFVDLSVLITDLENQYEELDICGTARKKLEILASAYAQLVHKTLTISQHNAKLECVPFAQVEYPDVHTILEEKYLEETCQGSVVGGVILEDQEGISRALKDIIEDIDADAGGMYSLVLEKVSPEVQ
ncbi:unnamed protein product [Darwinula stevensoni]|uniref:Uncharacterized protein n=1 Tax=Darwinula stevensoni TaxID=69355 RepID=A0A7R8X8J9_9CRUS|nr:unnamed protein product [Darwinula stevensoni]CAG0890207.1 unnamed protein product [Darwinula stevensoni]